MDTKKLSQTDLNLLVALQVLLEEQHISKAAERLFITQSAMSKTLLRLRTLFQDQLFTRAKRGIIPTPRALELYAELETALHKVDEVISDKYTDPSQFRGKVILSALDYFSLPLLPSLISILCDDAPNLQIKVTHETDIHLREMAEGRIDISINGQRPDYDNHDFLVEKLLTTEPVILMSAKHPLKSLQNPSWDDIKEYPEVALKVPSEQHIENSWLRSYLMSYVDLDRIILETTDYLSALQTLANTDTVMFVPRMSLDFVKLTKAITTMSLPDEKPISINVVMVFHRRTENSQKHIWLREQIKRIYTAQNNLFCKRNE